jgi:hypothetical protein
LKRVSLLIMAILLALVVATPVAFAQVGQGSKASGKAAELAADWFVWALGKPTDVNPTQGEYTGGPKCDGQPLSDTTGRTWFLAGTFGQSEVTRNCTAPVGTKFFFPVVNSFCAEPLGTSTEEQLRQCATAFIPEVLADPNLSISVTVDGKEIESNRIVRADSPLFTFTLPKDNIFGEPKIGVYEGVGDGLWVTLPPLSKGEHTIHIEVSAPSVDFSQDVTYNLDVVPGNSGGKAKKHKQ